jgi:predicted dehydrogenase
MESPVLKGCYSVYLNGLGNSILKGQKPPVSGSDAALVIQIIESALESHDAGRVVTFSKTPHEGLS